MNSKIALITTLFMAQAAFSGLALAEEKVNNYVGAASGGVVTTGTGDCLRTNYMDTTEKKVECGYPAPKPPVTTKVEIVTTPSAVSVSTKVMEKVTVSGQMLFAFDSAELTEDAKTIIDERIERIKGRVKLTSIMKVEGHTDSTGPEAYNQKLSQRRAEAVADYIAKNSVRVRADDIQAIGKGESEPVESNDTKEGRALNRRVVIFAEGVVDAAAK